MALNTWNLTTVRQDVSTTNATVTTILTIVLPTAGNVVGQAFVNARDSGGNAKSWNVNFGGKSVAGVASVLGAVASLLAVGDAGAATWAVSVSASSGNILLQVTGALATNIDWSAYVTTYQAS